LNQHASTATTEGGESAAEGQSDRGYGAVQQRLKHPGTHLGVARKTPVNRPAQNMAQIVQQAGEHHLVAGAVGCGQRSGLKRVVRSEQLRQSQSPGDHTSGKTSPKASSFWPVSGSYTANAGGSGTFWPFCRRYVVRGPA